jgi:hypothetical protein
MELTQQERALEALGYVLSKGSLAVEKQQRANTTYTFIECDNNITYALISNKVSSFYALSVMTDGYNDVISMKNLFGEESEKSKLVWDLLESGGVRKYALELLSRNKIPNNSHLTDIDWNDVQGISKKS